MKLQWKRGLLAIAFAATIILADLGMGLDFQSIVPADPDTLLNDAPDTTERAWEGGGPDLAFADTMSGKLAAYFEEMDPLRNTPEDDPFDYYGGAVARTLPGEQPGRWEPRRWDAEWWRWGEESMQNLGGAEEQDPTLWRQEDGFLEDVVDVDVLRFGEPCDALFECRYPNDAFSAVVSPVVDLRNVEPLSRATHEETDYRVESPSPPPALFGDQNIISDLREQAANLTRQTGIVEVGQGTISVDAPAVHNASAALRLNHLYDFNAVGGRLEDGARVEVSKYDPALGWRDWEPLVPSHNKLRIGDDEFEGRYTRPTGNTESGLREARMEECRSFEPPRTVCDPDASSRARIENGDDGFRAEVEADGSVIDSDDAGLNTTRGRPWLYQGEIGASDTRDPRGSWSGFGGTSGDFVESVFDLSGHAGHLVRFRFLTATVGENPVPGLGWLLEQMEVHALADAGVKTIGPVTPTEGALLGHGSGGTDHGDAHPVIALQNFDRETKEVAVKIGLEDRGETTQRVSVPPGPWGRVFVDASESMNQLGLMDEGLHHLNVAVMDVHGLDRPGLEAVSPVPLDEKRFHFMRVGPGWPVEDSWRAVRVETELLPRHEEDQVNPASREIHRDQAMRIHVELVNEGPEPVTLEFPTDPLETGSPLRPLLVNAQGDSRGKFELQGEDTITLPASREASGSLGDPHARRSVTWLWSGTPIAEILNLLVEDADNETVLDGGPVRVETMQSSVLDVDFENRWEYAGAEGCEHRSEMSGRTGVLLCEDGGSIASPASPVLSSYLRRGIKPFLSVSHRGGAADLTFETAEPERSPSPGDRVPPSDLEWVSHGSVTVGPSEGWRLKSFELPDFEAQWSGWLRVNVTSEDSDAQTLVDEIRVDVGPQERRFPLLWHGFTGVLQPQTGILRSSLDGGDLAVLSGQAARANDTVPAVSSEECSVASTKCGLEDDELTIGLSFPSYTASVATVAPGTSLLGLPADPEPDVSGIILNGSRPTLRFDHWMGPSVSAQGHVEVAPLDPELIRDLEAGLDVNLTWETVVSFSPPRAIPRETLSSLEVTLWEYAGEEVLIRFRYEYDAERQPGMAPSGWVLDAVSLEQTEPHGPQPLHRSTGDFEEDGYWSSNVEFNGTFEGARRAQPLVYDKDEMVEKTNSIEEITPRDRDRWMHFGRGDPRVPVCADLNHPNTYPISRSVVTDSVDLRAMETPLLALEHGGRFTRNSETNSPTGPGLRAPGTTIFDLEWQVLGQDGQWGEWHRAVPFVPWAVLNGQGPEDWSGDRLDALGLVDPEGNEVTAPFTNGTWEGHLVGEDASVFDLSRRGGPAGEIARFRFLVWEEWWGHTGNAYAGFASTPCDGQGDGDGGAYYDEEGIRMHFSFDWLLYSMRIFEDTHMLDAGVTGIRVSPNDRPLLNDLSPGLREWRDDPDPEIVVSGDVRSGLITVEVDVENHGVLDHIANVTLELVDERNRAVDVPIHFVDESQGIPRRLEDQNFGLLPLAGRGIRDAGESATATFRVEIGARGEVPPGNYSLRAFVDLDDGVDTNPANDVRERHLRVLPVRALDLDLSVTRVEPTVTTPETSRTLTLELRNRGNVEDTEVTVEASVVEIVGFGKEADLVEGTEYRLKSRTEGLAPGTTARFTWDLVSDQDGNELELASLLEPGTRYAINATIRPAPGSAQAWWDEDSGGAMQDELVDVIDPPGDHCGCYHVPFLAEALVAGSDLTPDGTFSVLDGYLDAAGSDPVDNWHTRTWFREDGRMQPADDRDDLPAWRLVDAAQADAAADRSGVQGSAWHLPAYDGYESLEHELRSPPIPAHIINETSRGILDLRYASGLHEDQATVEVRSLEPGGQWGDWHPVDNVRAHRVALVLPPDFPLVVSDRLSDALDNVSRYPSPATEGHPVPPFYTDPTPDSPVGEFVDNKSNSGSPENWEYNSTGYVSDPEQGGLHWWSPYPLYHEEPDAERNLESVEALATVLRMLAEDERVGADNVAVYTTFPSGENEEEWELGLPGDSGSLASLGIRLDNSSQAPMLDVRGDGTAVHRIPLRDMEELGHRIDTYGAMLLMGDGLTRWAGAQQGRSDVLDSLSPLLRKEIRDQVFENETGNLEVFQQPVGNSVPDELESHIQEVLPALRFAPTEGVRLIGATGPAAATIGASGVAEGVPLSVWTPPNTRDASLAPFIYRCMVELAPGQATLDPGQYWLNYMDQPKQSCVSPGHDGQGGRNNILYPGNYQYVSAPDAQAAALRQFMASRGARFALDDTVSCGPAPDFILRARHGDPLEAGLGSFPVRFLTFNCLAPQPVVSFENPAGVRFVTAPFAGNETLRGRTVEDWVHTVLYRLEGQPGLEAGTGNWERLPLSRGAPVGGTFRVDEEGMDRFSGETFQFRFVVRSDPFDQESPGHGDFFLDSFQFFGTPEEGPKPEIRVANPRHGDVRAPLEEDFYVTIEVINKGLGPLATNDAKVTMAQIPGRGDCEGESKCLASDFSEPGQFRDFQVDALGGGARHVATLGGDPLALAPGAPDGIRFSNEATAFNNGRFPRPDDASFKDWNDASDRMIFNVTARLIDPSVQNTVEVTGERTREPLLKNPVEDLIVEPIQANRGRDAGGIRGTDHLSLDVWLSNTGSFPNQDGTLSVEMYWAMPYDCFASGSVPFGNAPARRRCDADGNVLGHWKNDQKWLVFEHEENVRIERGAVPVLRGVDIDLEEHDIEPGVYQLDLTVATEGLDGNPPRTTRWVYIGDPDDPDGTRWATYDEDLMGISDTPIHQAWPPQQGNTNELNPDFFLQDRQGNDFSCAFDSTVTTNTDPKDPDTGDDLRHGWAISDDYQGPCRDEERRDLIVAESGSTILQWVRDEHKSFDEEERRWNQNSGNTPGQPNSNVPDELGLGDFGPARVVWHPEQNLSPQGTFNEGGVIPQDEPNEPAVSLANFAPGNASLLIDSRFIAAEHTGYVVEMQVAQRQCGSYSTGAGTTSRFGCIWAWGSNWFPLQPVLPGGQEPNDADIEWFVHPGGDPRNSSPPSGRECSSGSVGPPTCWRSFPTNPVSVRGTDPTSNQITPGLWGLSSLDGMEGADENGWVRVKYPIDPRVQPGLRDYCDQARSGNDTAAIVQEGMDFNQEVERQLFGCMYTAASADADDTQRSVRHETPRPVAFRLSAGSYGGDEGQNYWHVRGLTLTAHELALDGPDRFAVDMDDGDTRHVPVEIRNDGAVDDVVEVRIDMEAQPGVEVGVARSKHAQDFGKSFTERIPAGETRTVWVNVTAEFGVFDRAGTFDLEEITIIAQSLMAQIVDVRATVDVTLHQRDRADLAIEGMIVNNLASNGDGPIPASIGTPTHTSLRLQNEGHLGVDEPLVVRLLAQPIDETTGQPDCPGGASTCREEVARRVVDESFVPRCRGDADCIVIVNFEWTPDEMGLRELTAEVNLPGLGDAIDQIPESRFGNNAETRLVKVGPVPLADLHVEDVRLVPFDPNTGCGGPESDQERLIDGHTYCAQALLANRGNSVAMFPTIAFSVGAAEPWSFGVNFDVDRFDPQTEEWITSSPLRAVRPPTEAGTMEFRVEADTQSATETVSGLERRLNILVDDYDLDLRSSELPDPMIEQGGMAELKLEVRNSGTVVATPVARIGAETDSLRSELVQPPPLQPGESAMLTLQVRAGTSAPEGPRDVEISLTTAQDPLVDVPLPFRVTVVGDAPLNATVLPIDTVPGPATMEFVADNTQWATDSTWTPTDATGAITLQEADDEPAFAVDSRNVRLHPLAVEIERHTPPGAYNGTIRFDVSHGPLTTTVEAPYELKILPDPGIGAHMVQDHVVSVKGLDTNVTLQMSNEGNQPVEIVLESQVDAGSLLQADTELFLEPGGRQRVDVHVRPGEATRALGETRVQWRVADTDEWRNEREPLLWTVRQVPTGVRLESTTLHEVQPVPQQMQTVRVTLRNPTTVGVEAEALIAINGLMHSRERTTLAPGSVSVIQLPLMLEEPGENTLQVVARPAGSQVGLSDPVFHEVGGVDSREITIDPQDPANEVSDDARSLPLPGVGVLLAALGAALAFLPRLCPARSGLHAGASGDRRRASEERPHGRGDTDGRLDGSGAHPADGTPRVEAAPTHASPHRSTHARTRLTGPDRTIIHPPPRHRIGPDGSEGGCAK